METYKEMKQRHQQEINALPIAFAFSDEQLKETLAEWNISEEDAIAGAIINIGGGGIIRACDSELIIDAFTRIDEERRAAIAADHTGNGYIYEMFLYELRNREYSYTQDETETLEALGISAEDLIASEALTHGLEKAIATINAI